MEITQYHKDIFFAKICPYCKSETKIISETDVYGFEYKGRKIIACKNFPLCDSYVGTHEDGSPLGRLSDRNLRALKKRTHDKFDELWKTNKLKRSQCYKELSEFLNIPNEYTHIGMFSEKTLKKTIEWSIDRLEN